MNSIPAADRPAEPVQAQVARFDWRYWARRLLVCNPFFLCSAALLLFGVNRLSTDPNFLANETQNLLFNFFALQFYEVLVVGVAIVLARRSVWYDAALLVVLENGLVLVPFMLISQATLIGGTWQAVLTLGGGGLVLSRFASIRCWFKRFNLPPRALVLGLIILAANVALPRIFRPWIEMDVQDWSRPNLIAWSVVLPLLAAGANLLPFPTRYGGLHPERHWLPLFVYGLWIAGSAVHLWCVQHICDLPFRLSQLAPVAGVAAWTMRHRIRDCLPNVTPRCERNALLATFPAPILAAGELRLMLALLSIQLMAYLFLAWRGRETMRALAGKLALATAAWLLVGLPTETLEWAGGSRREIIGAGATLSLLVYAIRSARPDAGFLAALVVAMHVAWWFKPMTLHPLLQAGLTVLMLHSLRWRELVHPGTTFLRNVVALVWIADAALFTWPGHWDAFAMTASEGFLVFAGWLICWCLQKQPGPLLLPIAAALMLLTGPGTWLLRRGSTGVLALVGSMTLFLLGFVLAWTRHRWDLWSNPLAPAPISAEGKDAGEEEEAR